MDDFKQSGTARLWRGTGSQDNQADRDPRESLREAIFGGKSLKEIERAAVEYALERTGGNKSAAARTLRVPIATFKRMLKRYQDEDQTPR